jgi:hypothetical protein
VSCTVRDPSDDNRKRALTVETTAKLRHVDVEGKLLPDQVEVLRQNQQSLTVKLR